MYNDEDDEGQDTITLESFLKSFIPCVSGQKRERYIRSISRVVDAMGEEGKTRITWDQYLAFQYYLDQIEKLKYKVAQYRYIDYEMFVSDIQQFNKFHAGCRAKNIAISDVQTKAMFLFLDADESGELEPEEILGVLQEKMMLGRNKEIEARDAAVETAKYYLKKAEGFVREIIGYY